MTERKNIQPYHGFEQGPIRPPSEAESLLVRVTRNCHWNRCAFCPVYKGATFSIRPVEHVLRDLDAVARHLETLSLISAGPGLLMEEDVRAVLGELPPEETASFRAALAWFKAGMESAFLQDADSLVVRPAGLIRILSRLRELFPTVKRITSYSRSQTIDRMSEADLQALAAAGLNRIHIGMESGCDKVLAMMHKGATGEMHVRAGLKVKSAGIELSEYHMPGLGGMDLWREHARDSATVLSRIDPHFIRLRTLAIPDRAPLAEEVSAGRFRKCSDQQVAEELLLFLEGLHGVTGYLASDHVLNLLPELEGRLPADLSHMTGLVKDFLALEPETSFIYRLGRRLGIINRLADTRDPALKLQVLAAAERFGVTPENLDQVTEALMSRFI